MRQDLDSARPSLDAALACIVSAVLSLVLRSKTLVVKSAPSAPWFWREETLSCEKEGGR